MSRRLGSVMLAFVASLVVSAPAQAAKDPLNAFRVKPTAENKRQLAAAGFDLTEGDRGRYIEVYATGKQARELRADGVSLNRVTNFRPRGVPADYTGSDAAWTVWTRYDAVADAKEQYTEQYDRIDAKPIAKKVSIGETHLGRDIWAVKVTKDADDEADGTKPAVLYNSIQHAREWLAGETCRRTLDFFVDNYGNTGTAVNHDGDPMPGFTAEEVTELVDTRELWFVCISNPDGYEYTFTEDNRLWRKNMADNDNDGIRGEPEDGVDPNRNFSTNWGQDNEGSSDDPTSETFRGPGPASEPETQAMHNLWKRVDFAFQKNDHTAAELLLYPFGNQQYTPTPDNGIFEALAGNDVDSAIADKLFDEGDPAEEGDESWEIADSPLDADTSRNRFDPDLGAELYITNGDTLEDAYHNGILGFTPEGSEPADENVSGFEFQDDEEDVEAEFQRHLLFSLDLARSAADPATPSSHLGNGVEDFYVDDFAVSYGDPQAVEVSAKRSLGDIRLRYRINDGNVQQAPTKAAPGGERFNNEKGIYYQRLRGEVTGTEPGDEVEVWFEPESGPGHSRHFTYTARKESNNKVLVLASENYAGPTPAQDPDGPHYLSYYTDALDANGVGYDVYDVDRLGHQAPDPLGVLGHYDAVIWYTGDDYLARRPGQAPGQGTGRFAVEEMIAVRAFLNEGGKLLYTGKNAGRQYAEGQEFRNFGFPEPDGVPGSAVGLNVYDPQYCNKNGAVNPSPEFDENDPTLSDGCIAHNDDFLQYYLGAYIYVSGGNSAEETEDGGYFPYNIKGEDGPFKGLTWGFDETGAGNQDHTATFAITSSLLDPQRYPTFADSRSLASWLRPGAGPFSPFSGQYYMASNAHSGAYKRLGKEIDLSDADSGELTFKFSSDLEADWDYMMVEARVLDDDGDDSNDVWTTLPDTAPEDERVTQQGTGESCAEGLANGSDALHPFLLHYYNTACEPEGTTGEWHAFTGNSHGWADWTVDLTPFAGERIELYITNVTDWGTLGLGTWIDDVKVTLDDEVVESNDFESGTGGWEPAPPPAGTEFTEPAPNWTRATQQFTEGGIVGTKDTILTGFGFEGMSAAQRPEFMKRAMKYLGVLKDTGGGSPATPAQPVQPSATPKPKGAKLSISKNRIRAKKGKVRIRVSCPRSADRFCKGTLRLRAGKRTLGSKRYTVAAGKAKVVTVKLKKSARKLLARKKGRLRVTISATSTDASGVMRRSSRRMTLRRSR
jgi:Zinc carboxypeptidase/Immune inhibitor A-like, MAM domain